MNSLYIRLVCIIFCLNYSKFIFIMFSIAQASYKILSLLLIVHCSRNDIGAVSRGR